MIELALAAVLAQGSAAQPALGCEPGDGIPDEYCQLSRDGIAAIAEGRFADAIPLLGQALRLSLFEMPNYELTGYLALAYCASGDRDTGRSLLVDFRCMLSVDAGELSCYVPGVESPQRGPGLSSECFEAMCGEIYLPYYDSPAPDTMKRVRLLRRQAAAVEKACEP